VKQHIPLLFAFGMILFSCKKIKENKYFTGTIEYRYTYISDSLNTDSLTKERTGHSYFRYDTINYQSRFTGKDTATYYYSGLRNKAISFTGNPVVYGCEDYSVFTDSVLSVKHYDTEATVLGYNCEILEIQKKNSSVLYVVSKDLIIAPGTYRQHQSYNWDVYGREAGGGLILLSEHRFKKFTMIGVATAVQISKEPGFRALEINDSLFAVLCK
jgi:hypothetical protein